MENLVRIVVVVVVVMRFGGGVQTGFGFTGFTGNSFAIVGITGFYRAVVVTVVA